MNRDFLDQIFLLRRSECAKQRQCSSWKCKLDEAICEEKLVDEGNRLLLPPINLAAKCAVYNVLHMLTLSRAKWTALTGYLLFAAGIILYTQLGNIENLSENSSFGNEVLDYGVLVSFAATFGGFLVAIVSSVIWARRAVTRQPLKVAVLIGAANVILTSALGVNIHGPTAILMFPVPLSVLSIVSLLLVTRWGLDER